MIKISYDRNMLEQIQRKLGRMKSEAPKVLKNALNQTARQARTDLKEQVKKRYAITKVNKISQAMKIQRAKNSKLEATIFVKGKTLNITSYKVTTPKKGAKAQVLKGKGLKRIVGPKKIMAFGGLNGLIWQRKKKSRYPIVPLKSLSIPKAVENKKVYGMVKPYIKNNLKQNVDAQVRKILGE